MGIMILMKNNIKRTNFVGPFLMNKVNNKIKRKGEALTVHKIMKCVQQGI